MFNEKTKKQVPADNEAGEKKEVSTTSKNVDVAMLMPHDLGDEDVLDNVFNQLEDGKTKRTLSEVTSDYLRLEDLNEGRDYPFIFTGMGRMSIVDKNTGEEKEIEVVNLLSKERQSLSCGAAVVVSALKKVDKIPCGIIISVTGKKPGKDYYNARVSVLK